MKEIFRKAYNLEEKKTRRESMDMKDLDLPCHCPTSMRRYRVPTILHPPNHTSIAVCYCLDTRETHTLIEILIMVSLLHTTLDNICGAGDTHS